MDKIAMYKEQIEKTAGAFAGAALGGIGGAWAGNRLGTAYSNVRYPRNIEMKNLNNHLQKVEEERLDVPYISFADETVAHIDNLTPAEQEALTVKDVQDIAYNIYASKTKSLTKTASLKSTGIAAAIVGLPVGALSFGHAKSIQQILNTDKQHLLGLIKKEEDELQRRKEWHTNPSKKVFLATEDESHPANFIGDYDEEQSISDMGRIVDAYIKDHKIDRNKMKFNDYKALVRDIDDSFWDLEKDTGHVDFNRHPIVEAKRVRMGLPSNVDYGTFEDNVTKYQNVTFNQGKTANDYKEEIEKIAKKNQKKDNRPGLALAKTLLLMGGIIALPAVAAKLGDISRKPLSSYMSRGYKVPKIRGPKEYSANGFGSLKELGKEFEALTGKKISDFKYAEELRRELRKITNINNPDRNVGSGAARKFQRAANMMRFLKKNGM